MDDKNQIFRNLPQVEKLLQSEEVFPFIAEIGRAAVGEICRAVLAEARGVVEREGSIDLSGIVPSIAARCRLKKMHRIQRVINGTGVVIHTNLGRAPLSPEILGRLAAEMSGYCNLELDLPRQKRGSRGGFSEELICTMTGSEDALLVNNNASSVFLILSELAAGKEVVVSRGELVQIGGGFRLPDIMRQSGARLVEAGTTNITTVADYRAAMTGNTAMIFSCHRSNFTMQGFIGSPRLAELAALKNDSVIFVRDLGSGNMAPDQGLPRPFEPTVRYELEQGPDLVCFSGDKLLGGCQAGIIVGRKELVARLRKNPLMRMIRPDKLTYFILQETLLRYVNGEANEISSWRIMTQGEKEIATRINRFMRIIKHPEKARFVSRTGTMSTVGGGAMPGYRLESRGVRIQVPGRGADDVYASLLAAPVPVVGIIADGAFILDFRTILDPDVPAAAAAVDALLAGGSGR
ncbi:MAG TPA: L-seryl-tRNA(Sec) selenium transferase [Spirochaetota bacterium]|nr:L-seryl-tRNA(Sec) selenium transferase [Spirochaetota bacterium]HOD15971.1 L-seryl-tRNA(Sec) selenium transferase [Spirochaetota bacterium]HPG51100.1 L-seryl-tRNA(Sec) selenium transferase [Spirochaetota bacterium]HPN11001.1 L-seryl-tRNA(Sec) selenium transferase [Spirochaetota bacterium]